MSKHRSAAAKKKAPPPLPAAKKKRPALSCAIIARYAPNLEKAVASIRPMVDEVVVVWTGEGERRKIPGVDRSVLCLDFNATADCPPTLPCGCKVGDFLDFAGARNRAFELTTGEHIVWMDSDDEVVADSPDTLRKLATTLTGDDLISFPYEYTYHADGKPCDLYPLPRIASRHHRWAGPIHECLFPQPSPLRIEKGAVWKHRRSADENQRSLQRNYRIARHWENSDRCRNDGRFLYYLGQSIRDIGKIQKDEADRHRYYNWAAIAYARAYGTSGSYDEKYLAAEWITEMMTEMGRYGDALGWAASAAVVAAPWSQSLLLLGRGFYHLSRDSKNPPEKQAFARHAVTLLRAALKEKQGESVLPYSHRVAIEVHVYLNLMLFELGDIQGALESCEAGLALEDNTFLRSNRLLCKAHLGRMRLREGVAMLTEAESPENDHLPAGRATSDTVDQAFNEVAHHLEFIMPGKFGRGPARERREVRRIAFVIGYQWVKWTPASGAPGGSEIAVVELTKRLAARGYEVHVFSSPGVDEVTVFDGVTWHPSAYSEDGDEFDLLVAWRGLDRVEGGKAPRRVLWMHDMDIQHVTPKRIAMLDGIVVNSRWHEDIVRKQLGSAKPFHVCGAGIDPKKLGELATDVERDGFQCFWSSSFDRGLDFMVDIWPEVRAHVHGARLAVAYGFDGSLNMAKKLGNDLGVAQIEAVWTKCEETEGVRLLNAGKRASDEVYFQTLRTSGVWAYPVPAAHNNFGETFCLHGDSRISVPGDHRGGPPTIAIRDLVGLSGFPVYAYDEAANRFVLATCNRVWETKVADEIVALELDSGETLRLTPEHLVMTWDREWVPASSLTPGVRLLALNYRYNVAIQDGNGRWTNEHRLVGEWIYGRPLTREEHVDHLDPERLDNSLDRLQVLSASEHFRKTHAGKSLTPGHKRRTGAGTSAWAAAHPDEVRCRNSRAGHASKAALDARTPEDRAAFLANRNAAHSLSMKEALRSNPELSAMFRQHLSRAHEIQAAMRAADPNKARLGSEAGRAAILRMAKEDPEWQQRRLERMREGVIRAHARRKDEQERAKNHRVVSVTRIPGGPVYDMEIDRLHNFVADGIVVHNCVSAAEAAACGLNIVVSLKGALDEVAAPFAFAQVYGAREDWSYRQAFVSAIVNAMSPARNDRALRAAAARERFDWDRVADRWVERVIG